MAKNPSDTTVVTKNENYPGGKTDPANRVLPVGQTSETYPPGSESETYVGTPKPDAYGRTAMMAETNPPGSESETYVPPSVENVGNLRDEPFPAGPSKTDAYLREGKATGLQTVKTETLETLSIKVAALADDLKSLESACRLTWARIQNQRRGGGGLTDESRHYCTDCGEDVAPDGRCKAHPAAKVNHGGTDPRTGQPITLRTT